MWITRFRWCVLLITLSSLTACVGYTPRQERTVTTTPVIVTQVPVAREVVVVPVGYVSCRVVPGTWYYSTWIPAHRVCNYTNRPGKVVWVDGYWACTKSVVSTGQCRHWAWRPARWSNVATVTY